MTLFLFSDVCCHTFLTRVSFLRYFQTLCSINLSATTFAGVDFDGTAKATFEVIAMSSTSTSPASTLTSVSSNVDGDSKFQSSSGYQPRGGSRSLSFPVTVFHCRADSFWDHRATGKNSSGGDTGACLHCTDGIDSEIKVRHVAVCDFVTNVHIIHFPRVPEPSSDRASFEAYLACSVHIIPITGQCIRFCHLV